MGDSLHFRRTGRGRGCSVPSLLSAHVSRPLTSGICADDITHNKRGRLNIQQQVKLKYVPTRSP